MEQTTAGQRGPCIGICGPPMDALECSGHIEENDERRIASVVSGDFALDLLHFPRGKRRDPPAIGGG
eukprot:3639736-Alexandrium_andersonii.AAC.1